MLLHLFEHHLVGRDLCSRCTVRRRLLLTNLVHGNELLPLRLRQLSPELLEAVRMRLEFLVVRMINWLQVELFRRCKSTSGPQPR